MSSTNIPSEVNDKVVEHLNEMLSAENAAIDRLESRIQECILPEAKLRLQLHLDETRQHQERLSKIISGVGGNPTDAKADLSTLRLPAGALAKKAITNMTKSITGQSDTNPMREEVELLRTKEDYGIEHVEILSYKVLIQLCQRLGLGSAVPLLNQSLQEEESMARWIETNAPTTFNQLWSRIEAAVRGISKDQASQTTGTTTAATTG